MHNLRSKHNLREKAIESLLPLVGAREKAVDIDVYHIRLRFPGFTTGVGNLFPIKGHLNFYNVLRKGHTELLKTYITPTSPRLWLGLLLFGEGV